jgi:SAM-dependent methyltransferase
MRRAALSGYAALFAESGALAEILARHLDGATAAPIAVVHLLDAARDASEIEAFLAEAARALADDRAAAERVGSLLALVRDHRAGCDAVVALLARAEHAARDRADPVAACRALFDDAADHGEEASVALYSLGSPALLAAATDEVVRELARRGVLGRDRVALELGCGTGRVLAAVAPYVAHVIGLDLSPRMVEVARRRTVARANVDVALVDGRRLDLAPASLDLVLAVDSLPYLVAAGPDVVDAHLAAIARALRPGGDFVVLNWSYRGDLDMDLAEARALAEREGLDAPVAGEAPLATWDGRLFHLRRPRA